MTDIKIPEGELAAVLQKAILDSLSDGTKERLIQGALQYLITAPRKDRYGSGPDKSPLQEAFDRALMGLAHRVAEEVIEQNGVREKLLENFADFLKNCPDLYDDWDLQVKIFRAIINRANEIKDGK